MVVYFTDDQFCPAHPDIPDSEWKCSLPHGPNPGSWANIRWYNGQMRLTGDWIDVEETEPPTAIEDY